MATVNLSSSIGSLTMKLRPLSTLTTISALALALALSACAPKQTSSPIPTLDASIIPPVDSVHFSDGPALPSDTDIAWGDGFAGDDGWHEVEHLTEPGRWAYANRDETCVAAFHSGPLGDSAATNDRDASDALITAALGGDLGDLDGLPSDGYFFRYKSEGAQVDHRQFSVTVDSFGRFIAARAFVALNYSVIVTVMCEGTDVTSAADEVLSKNMISIGPETLD